MDEWPSAPGVSVLGISDNWPPFKRRLGDRFTYISTHFDADNKFDSSYVDVCYPPSRFLDSADVILCSDVLEHVEPPAQRGFDGLYAMLKPGGRLILTVPYSLNATVEHFPDLRPRQFRWHLEKRTHGYVLVNITAAGEYKEYHNLEFHGGGEAVLEMRVFGLTDVLAHMRQAGLEDCTVLEHEELRYGIRLGRIGRPFTATKPHLRASSNGKA